MWAIDPTAKPLPKHLLRKGTQLEISIESQRQFLYQLRAQDYDQALKDHEQQNKITGANPDTKIFEKTEHGDDFCFMRKCSAFEMNIYVNRESKNTQIIGG